MFDLILLFFRPKCVPGQFLVISSKQCQFCPRGTYQDEPLQTTCRACPTDHTTSSGNINKFSDILSVREAVQKQKHDIGFKNLFSSGSYPREPMLFHQSVFDRRRQLFLARNLVSLFLSLLALLRLLALICRMTTMFQVSNVNVNLAIEATELIAQVASI